MDISSLMNNDGAQAARPAPPPPQQQQQAQAQAQAQEQQAARDREAHRNSGFPPPPPPPPRSSSGNFGSPVSQHHQQQQHQHHQHQQQQQQQYHQQYQQQLQQQQQQHHHHQQYAQKPAPPQAPYHHAPQQPEHRPSNGTTPVRSAHLTPLHTPSQVPLHTPSQVPLHTPSHAPGGPGYPFPTQHQSSSPSQPQAQSHRGPEPYSAVTPGGSRPAVPVYQYGQPAQSPYGPPSNPPGQYQSTSHSSMSPTPPVHHQPPQPVRESPVPASAGHAHHHNTQHVVSGPHHSQPSTPLGPPSVQYPRPSAHGQRETQSPYAVHHRTLSGASYGAGQSMASNSPAPSGPHSANMVESPAMYAPPAQYKRPSGEYLGSLERERSVSVSPKTTVIRRHPSMGSRYGSQDPASARGSFSEAPPGFDRTLQRASQPAVDAHLRSSGDMSSNTAISPMTRPIHSARNVPVVASPVSQRGYGSQTPQLKNLLNDGIIPASPIRQSPASHPRQSPLAQHPGANGAQSSVPPRIKSESSSGFGQGSLLQQPLGPSVSVVVPTSVPAPVTESPASQTTALPSSAESGVGEPRPVPQTSAQKRPAESEPERVAPVKKMKKRYAQPPIWARFHASNPRFDANNPQHVAPINPPPQIKRETPQVAQQAAPTPQINGQHLPPNPQATTNGDGKPPPPPPPRHMNGTDSDAKARASAILGPWEMSLVDQVPMSDVVKTVGDWLMAEMLSRPDVGVGDARNGALEIEAKLGTLCDRGSGNRIRFPFLTTAVLDPGWSRENVKFESKMTEVQHKTMNEFLNKRTQESMLPGKVRMDYKHRYERDTFAALSHAGVNALPQAARNYLQGRYNPRLRTTHNSRPKAGENALLAKIVKIRLADLDILSPFTDFDCRISMNIEVDMLNRPDIDPSLIVEPAERERDGQGERLKDRVSYKHLAYSVDLTQVILQNGEKCHELEIEVDAVKLREHAVKATEGQVNAYGDLIEGLVNNVLLLAKVRGP
ncbi:hypothetical protein MBLNU459_g8141t1 [Dothideomycetes sp. NU459]